MQKLRIQTAKTNPDEDKLIESLLNNPSVQDLLKHYNADEQCVRDNPYIFNTWVTSMKNMENEYGSINMSNSDASYYKDLEIVDNIPRFVIRRSKWQVENDNKLAHKKNYLYCDLSDEQLLLDINAINLTNESDSYRKLYELVKRWLNKLPEKGLYLCGGLGAGKTYLAACMTNYLARKGNKVAFVNVPGFFAKARNAVSNSYDYKNQADFISSSLNRLKKAQFLVLDDIGAENVTNWVRDDLLLPLLDYRMENKKTTIFTSNSDFKDLTERLSYNQYGQKDELKAERIMERVRTLAVEVKVSGNSRRK